MPIERLSRGWVRGVALPRQPSDLSAALIGASRTIRCWRSPPCAASSRTLRDLDRGHSASCSVQFISVGCGRKKFRHRETSLITPALAFEPNKLALGDAMSDNNDHSSQTTPARVPDDPRFTEALANIEHLMETAAALDKAFEGPKLVDRVDELAKKLNPPTPSQVLKVGADEGQRAGACQQRRIPASIAPRDFRPWGAIDFRLPDLPRNEKGPQQKTPPRGSNSTRRQPSAVSNAG